MSWGDLFERAADYDVTLAEVREAALRRDGADEGSASSSDSQTRQETDSGEES